MITMGSLWGKILIKNSVLHKLAKNLDEDMMNSL